MWSVREEERIYFHKQEGGRAKKRDSREAKFREGAPMTSLVLVEGVKDPRGLSVDWVGRNLYYIEGESASVSVLNLDTRFTVRLEEELDLDDPQDIVVDPLSGRSVCFLFKMMVFISQTLTTNTTLFTSTGGYSVEGR